MIEINLLPGASRKAKGRGTSVSLRAITQGVAAKVKDPFLLSAVACVAIAIAAVGGMYLTQTAQATDLEAREAQATADSARYALVLKDRRRAEAKRDSVTRQLAIIQSIDNNRFVWPRILDEVSRSLPPYTWLKSIAQTSLVEDPAAAAAVKPAANTAAADSAKGKGDPDPQQQVLRFRIVGHTVDIQALTRFMKMLETSPYVTNVQLARSEMVMLDGKEVTEFQLDAEYERPTAPVGTTETASLSMR